MMDFRLDCTLASRGLNGLLDPGDGGSSGIGGGGGMMRGSSPTGWGASCMMTRLRLSCIGAVGAGGSDGGSGRASCSFSPSKSDDEDEYADEA